MPWDPKVYLQFKEIRFKPFFDLMHLVAAKDLQNSIDIGCGTGEQTAMLSKTFETATFLGIDSSAEMLAESKQFESERLSFKLNTIEEFSESESNWDLIFSNAALQWSDNHSDLFPRLISKLNTGGQLAVQMPFQKENILNQLLFEMVSEEPFVDLLDGFHRNSPLLKIDEYAKIMFDNGLKDLNIFLKVYPIIATSETNLYDFIAGSSLIPYMERLDTSEQGLFKRKFTERIKKHFVTFPAIYPFKRIVMHGRKE